MQTEQHIDTTLLEEAGYFQVSDEHLYTVLHRVEDPVARVLLVGPFASERHQSYLPWVRWARYLAARRIEVLRFDYRGIGESTGTFEEMSFTNWSEDVELLASWLKEQSPDVPLVLHGLDMGALLAGRSFHSGTGDALLMWSPPVNANQALRSTLMRWVGLEQIFKGPDERKSASDYIRQFERDSFVEVDGYPWSSQLWSDSFGVELPDALGGEDRAAATYRRPVRIVRLGKEAAPLAKGGSVGYDEAKDFSWLFAPNLDWVTGFLMTRKGSYEPSN
jgi:pimeloyl-ACP methyl ester carboxylesterase